MFFSRLQRREAFPLPAASHCSVHWREKQHNGCRWMSEQLISGCAPECPDVLLLQLTPIVPLGTVPAPAETALCSHSHSCSLRGLGKAGQGCPVVLSQRKGCTAPPWQRWNTALNPGPRDTRETTTAPSGGFECATSEGERLGYTALTILVFPFRDALLWETGAS